MTFNSFFNANTSESWSDLNGCCSPTDSSISLDMLEIEEQKLCTIVEFFESHYINQNLLISTPLDGLMPVHNHAQDLTGYVEGMILKDLDPKVSYPFVSLFVFNLSKCIPENIIASIDTKVKDTLGPRKTQQIGGFEEFDYIITSQGSSSLSRDRNNNVCYIVLAFKVIPGEDCTKLEDTWQLWTGANYINRSAPKEIGLKKIIFYKRFTSHNTFAYLVVCECAELLRYPTIGRDFVERLRARYCGYIALCKVVSE